jgi:protein-S-isoprenylcysteine O-methyltransferase Ste14
MTETIVLTGLWVLWVASWMLASRWTTQTEKQPPAREEMYYRAMTIAAALLIFWRVDRGGAGDLWDIDPVPGWVLITLTAAGLAFTWWARIHLGLLWSASITRKAGHHIIDTGPYRLVRHPIYAGLLFALYATALHRGTSFALAGAVVATIGFYVKARTEERFLSTELGNDAYAAYRRRVPMLLPFR